MSIEQGRECRDSRFSEPAEARSNTPEASPQQSKNPLNTLFRDTENESTKSTNTSPSVLDKLIDTYSDERAANKTMKAAISETCSALGTGRGLVGAFLGGASALSGLLAPQLMDLFNASSSTPVWWTAAAGLVAFPAIVSLGYILQGSFQEQMGEKLRRRETTGLVQQVLGLRYKDRSDQDARGEIATARSTIGSLAGLADYRYQALVVNSALTVSFAGLLYINPLLGGAVMLSSLYLRSVENQRTEFEKRLAKKIGKWQGLFHDANQAALDPDTASQLEAQGNADWLAERVSTNAERIEKMSSLAAKRNLGLSGKAWAVTGVTSMIAGSIMVYWASVGAVSLSSVGSFVIGMMTLQGTMWQAAYLRGEQERTSIKVQRNATLGRSLSLLLEEKRKQSCLPVPVQHTTTVSGEREAQTSAELPNQTAMRQPLTAGSEELGVGPQTNSPSERTEEEWLQMLKGKQLGIRATGLKYVEGENTLLDINETIIFRPGRIVAIVGMSGAGKSTLIRLIVGILEPTEGSMDVIIRDPESSSEEIVPRGEVPERVFRQFLAWSAQGSYSGRSLKLDEYLSLGRKPIGSNELSNLDALQFAAIPELATTLDSDSRDTPRIGYSGRLTKLSCGEAKRLVNAQAASGNKPIEIWDEPVEGLDGKTKIKVISNIINQKHSGKTVLYIAHDFSMLDEVDEILVLKDGRLVGSGSPKDVCAQCDEYRDLLEMQTKHLPKLIEKTPPMPNIFSL